MENLSIDLKTFLEITPHLVCIAGKDGYLKKVNPAVLRKLGYSEEELYSNHIFTFIHPDDVERTGERREELFSGNVLHDFVNRYVTKDGKTLWLEWTSVYLPENEYVLAIAKDITLRKEVEKQVEDEYNKYKSLATHFKKVIEKDKKHIAYELHEELAQLLSVINMDIGWLADQEPGLPQHVKERVEHASAISRQLIKTIQRLAFAISPQMLDDFGLHTTMGWLCNEFSILNNIPCVYEPGYDEKLLSHEMQVDFFRISQDALLYVLDHSEAGAIRIRMEDAVDSIRIRFIDSGAGFTTAHAKKEAGLLSIRERAASIHGVLREP
ncbi:MAG TPA: PAS domain S-box protein, partial [Ferruginibacter sp.]|nr:PAS domain S-box protein [Ferruginibacter sp.]